MATHRYQAVVEWKRNGQNFLGHQYHRDHRWAFDGGIEISASASPLIVATPQSNDKAVDPEEALIAAASSCHMLWFLSMAADRGVVVDSYRDEAVGLLERNPEGRMAITVITLRPVVEFSGNSKPARRDLEVLHQLAHDRCFIANSLKSDFRIEVI
ncbi:MAG: OsmC family protein [Planctomycetota bacterium]|nr:OsmC family protein [Planctomycetota bacterium]